LKDIANTELLAQIIEADRQNTKRLRELIALFGWPGKSLVGEFGAEAAWILAQHADRDPQFKAECLEKMKAASLEDVNAKHIAYLTDRVRVNTGQPQRYGTQFWTDENGVFGPRPLENEEKIEEYRASVGLEPFAEYRQTMQKIHDDAEKTR
jgi:hypothetical protein